MAAVKNFLIRGEHRDALSLLSQEEKGNLLDAMFAYNLDDESPEMEGMVKMAFAFMKNSFDSDKANYHKKCNANRDNGKKGGRPKKATETQQDDMDILGSNNNPENPVGFDESEGFEKNLNTKSKAKSNTKSKITPLTPQGEEVLVLDLSQEIEKTIDHWNSQENLPPCPYDSSNLPKGADIAQVVAVFHSGQISGAITNLSKFYGKIEPRFRPKSFQRFLLSSLDIWLDAAKPWERFQEEGSHGGEFRSACAPTEDHFRELTEEEWEDGVEGMEELKQVVFSHA